MATPLRGSRNGEEDDAGERLVYLDNALRAGAGWSGGSAARGRPRFAVQHSTSSGFEDGHSLPATPQTAQPLPHAAERAEELLTGSDLLSYVQRGL